MRYRHVWQVAGESKRSALCCRHELCVKSSDPCFHACLTAGRNYYSTRTPKRTEASSPRRNS